MKTNPLFLSSSEVEDNLRLLYQVFYNLRSIIINNTAQGDGDVDEMILLLTFPKTAKKLASELVISKQALHKRLHKIKEKKWIEEKISNIDGRQKIYYLNSEGAKVAQQMMLTAGKKMSEVYQQAGMESVAGFVKVIKLLYNQPNKKM